MFIHYIKYYNNICYDKILFWKQYIYIYIYIIGGAYGGVTAAATATAMAP